MSMSINHFNKQQTYKLEEIRSKLALYTDLFTIINLFIKENIIMNKNL